MFQHVFIDKIIEILKLYIVSGVNQRNKIIVSEILFYALTNREKKPRITRGNTLCFLILCFFDGFCWTEERINFFLFFTASGYSTLRTDWSSTKMKRLARHFPEYLPREATSPYYRRILDVRAKWFMKGFLVPELEIISCGCNGAISLGQDDLIKSTPRYYPQLIKIAKITASV